MSARPLARAAAVADGLRPVNLRLDLRPLADLIELVFADSMDSAGRSAIQEMRALSHLGYGLHLIARLNDLALGISLGFVYVMDGRLVGNISLYPAGYPRGMGETWILANVAVHPSYQRRGIARELVAASLEMIRGRSGRRVILQVNYDNVAALRLYERHGFVYERAWRHWRGSGYVNPPYAGESRFLISRPRQREWQSEYALAREVRPDERGGLGWLKPTHRSFFDISAGRRLLNLLSLNHREKLVIRGESAGRIVASCWVESAISSSGIGLRYFALPGVDYSPRAEALLLHVLGRYPHSTVSLEHPRDDEIMNDLLKRCHFKARRELWHMRLEL